MKIKIIAIGKCRDPSINALAGTYLARIKNYVPAQLVEIELKGRGKGAGRRIGKIITSRDHAVALDEGGKTFSSVGFAKYVESLLVRAERIAFLIGDAEGLPEEISGLAREKLSLSTMTLQHDMARILLLEQLYRALTILRGEPYHKG